jgi:serine/threonine protein kinase
MPGPITVDELLKLINKCGIVEAKTLATFLDGRTLDAAASARTLADAMIERGVLTHFQAEQLLQGKWRGFTIGRYKYLERIGIGGMGQVFLCEHIHTRRRVAIKVLPPAKAEQPAALGRFYREARAAAALQHPNVVRIHDIDRDGDLHFIVMEYVAGPNLLDLVKRFGPLDIGRATSYVHQVAGALDFAFRNGIIHRDVKPGNVMIDRYGVAHLLDLGLARFLNDQTDQLTLKYDDKIVLGTADYVAPEQIENSHAVDTRADIYALGSTFYFLLAGHPPFPTGTVSQKLLWHRTKKPPSIVEVRPELPAGLADVLSRMMAKDVKDRYQTPAQVISDLAEWLPESVPLPHSEELPRLSPAAMTEENPMVEVTDPDQGNNAKAAETGRTISSITPMASKLESEPSSGVQTAPRIGSHAGLPAAKTKRLSESETEESASLTIPHTARSVKRGKSPGKAEPASSRSGRWGLIGTLVIALLAALVLMLR